MNSSLFNKLVQMLPLIACGGFGVVVWTCVKVVEGVSKQGFKRQLAEAIATSSIFTVGKMLPAFALSAFDAIFTDELWSLRGFIRSCMASIFVVAILSGVWYSSIPDEWNVNLYTNANPYHPATMWFVIAIKQPTPPGFQNITIGPHGELGVIAQHPSKGTVQLQTQRPDIIFLIPLVYNLFADFMALLITRSIARHLSESLVSMRYVVLVFVLSSFSILVLSSAFLNLAVRITNYIVIGDLPSLTGSGESIVTPMNYLKAILFPLYKNHSELLGGWSIGTVYGVFVWSTLMGVVWLWIFSQALYRCFR